jgi:hypothetical protein
MVLLLDAETKLAADQDGSYRQQLVKCLEQYRDEFALSRQGLLPPEEYLVAEEMEAAITAALAIINAYKPAENVSGPTADGNLFSPKINI